MKRLHSRAFKPTELAVARVWTKINLLFCRSWRWRRGILHHEELAVSLLVTNDRGETTKNGCGEQEERGCTTAVVEVLFVNVSAIRPANETWCFIFMVSAPIVISSCIHNDLRTRGYISRSLADLRCQETRWLSDKGTGYGESTRGVRCLVLVRRNGVPNA